MGLSISVFELSDPETTKESGNTISGQSSPSGQQFSSPKRSVQPSRVALTTPLREAFRPVAVFAPQPIQLPTQTIQVPAEAITPNESTDHSAWNSVVRFAELIEERQELEHQDCSRRQRNSFRRRHFFTERDHEFLKSEYAKQSNWDVKHIARLATLLDVSRSRVFKWHYDYNRRQSC